MASNMVKENRQRIIAIESTQGIIINDIEWIKRGIFGLFGAIILNIIINLIQYSR